VSIGITWRQKIEIKTKGGRKSLVDFIKMGRME